MASDEHVRAMAHLRRVMGVIAAGAVLLSAEVLAYLAWAGPIQLHMVVAVRGGVFVATILGCGLFALAVFSDQSGHDREADEATRKRRD